MAANPIPNADLPPYLQAVRATFDEYGGVIAGITLTTGAAVPTSPPAGESCRYTLMINGADVIGVEVAAGCAPFVVGSTPKIPDFPQAQMNSWEVKLNGDTLSFRFPASSLEPYLGATSKLGDEERAIRRRGLRRTDDHADAAADVHGPAVSVPHVAQTLLSVPPSWVRRPALRLIAET